MSTSEEDLVKQQKDLEFFVKVLAQAPELMDFFSSSHFSFQKKMESLKKNFADTFDDKLLNFLFFLIEKGRFKYLPIITKEFNRLVSQRFKFLDAHLITAFPFDVASKEKLKEKLEKFYNSKIKITEEIDPQLLGGGVLTVGNQQFDFSIKGKIDRLYQYLIKGV